MKNINGGVFLHCISEIRKWRCTLMWVSNLGKIISKSKTWYHMHVEMSRTLHALEIGDLCHTWLCVLVKLGEWLWLCEKVNLYILIYYASMLEEDRWCGNSLLNDLIKYLIFNHWKWICCFTFIWLYIICGI